jgi:hypothetical protein
MKVEIKPNPQYPQFYDLYVNGRKKIDMETIIVCDNIRHALLNLPDNGEYSECDEVADSIRRYES